MRYAYKAYATQVIVELSLRDQERFRNRLHAEMNRRGIKNQYEFATLLDISPQYLGQIFGGSRMGVRQLINFSKRLKVPVSYLLGLEDYQEWWSLQDEYAAVPLVQGNIAANPTGEIPGDAVESRLWLHKAELGSRHDLVAVRLGNNADSMTPALHPGDLVVIDRADREITAHGLYAVRLPDMESCAIKRIQPVPGKEYILLLSENTHYPPEPVPWHEHLIIGRVIWSWTNWVR